MMKKILAIAAAAVLALTLTACTGTTEQLPTLTLTESSQTSGGESAAESGAETSQTETVELEPVSDQEFEDSLEGLCQYLEANKAVTGEPTEMAYETIGATGGFRYRFTLNGGTVQVEVYSYDRDNLNQQGMECISSVEEKGFFVLLDKEIPATLNQKETLMMIYTDTSTNQENLSQKERVTQLFLDFKA